MSSIMAADARLAAVAVAQQGVFTRAQARRGLRRRRRSNAAYAPEVWERVLPRVYRHAATPASSALVALGGGLVGRARLRALAHERGRDLAHPRARPWRGRS